MLIKATKMIYFCSSLHEFLHQKIFSNPPLRGKHHFKHFFEKQNSQPICFLYQIWHLVSCDGTSIPDRIHESAINLFIRSCKNSTPWDASAAWRSTNHMALTFTGYGGKTICSLIMLTISRFSCHTILFTKRNRYWTKVMAMCLACREDITLQCAITNMGS